MARRAGVGSGDSQGRPPRPIGASSGGRFEPGRRQAVPRRHVLTTVHADGDGTTAIFADGSSQSFDVLVGADGYRSLVRSHLSAQTQPDYAGYVAWRGSYPRSASSTARSSIAATRRAPGTSSASTRPRDRLHRARL